MQCACAVLSAAACPAVPCSTMLSRNGTIFGGGEEESLNINVGFDFLYSFYLKYFNS